MSRRFTYVMHDDLYKYLSRERDRTGTSISDLITTAIEENLLSDPKVTTLIRAVYRLRNKVYENEKSIFTFFRAFEQFLQFYFILTPAIEKTEIPERVRDGEARYELFKRQFFNELPGNPFPTLMEDIIHEWMAEKENLDPSDKNF